MVRVEIKEDLFEEIEKKFKRESIKIFSLMNSLKGKLIGNIGEIVIKELKYKTFRFFFITDGLILKYYSEEAILDLLIKFVRMAHKKHQQKTINEIKKILRDLGPKFL